MKKTILNVFLPLIITFSFFATPVITNASTLTSSQITAIVSLLQSFGADQSTINNIQTSLSGGIPSSNPAPAPTNTTSTTCYTFNDNMKIGDTGSEVSVLQTYLSQDGETVAVSGIFDDQTSSAVSAFQQKYASNILIPVGLSAGTGYVGASTRAKLNSLYGCGNTTANPAPAPASTQTTQSSIQKQPIHPPISTPTINAITSRGNESNQFYPGDTVIISGSNLPQNPGITIGSSSVRGQTDPMGQSITFTAPVWLPTGSYRLYITNGLEYPAEVDSNSLPVIVLDKITSSLNPTITVVSPNGGESLIAGQTYQIQWTSTDPVSLVGINLLQNNIGYLGIGNVPNTGSYTWKVPNNISGSNFKIQIIGNGETSTSNAPFSIGTNVTASLLIITNPSPLPNATVGVNYSFALNVLGLPAGYNTNQLGWSITSGALPNGMYLGYGGNPVIGEIIAGDPISTGNYNFAVTVTAPSTSGITANTTATKQFTLAVNPSTNPAVPPTSPISVSPTFLNFTVNGGSINNPSGPQTITLTNFPDTLASAISKSYTSPLPSGADWLAISHLVSVNNGTAKTITVSVTPNNAPGGLGTGTYTASIIISANGQTITIPVTLTVTGPTIANLAPTVTLAPPAGGTFPLNQGDITTISYSTNTSGPLSFYYEGTSGQIPTFIRTVTSSAGNFNWIVPTIAGNWRIRAIDGSGTIVYSNVFTINTPTPSIVTNVAPHISGLEGFNSSTGAYSIGSVNAGDTLVVYGTFPASGNTVIVDGTSYTPTSQSTSQINVLLLGSALGQQLPVTVTNANGTSNSQSITINAPVSSTPPPPNTSSGTHISGVQGYNPSTNVYTTGTATAGKYLVLYGTFASSGNTVYVGGISYTPAFESATQINILLGATTGQLSVTVSNAKGSDTASVSVTAQTSFAPSTQDQIANVISAIQTLTLELAKLKGGN